MNSWYNKLLFSILVTLVMNALDMLYHLSTSWAVHLNYAAVKLTLIFLSVYLITALVGIGKQEGIVASILGPFMFYVYYVFANPTLNREVFNIDEQFWFFFLHAAFMLVAYFAMRYSVQKASVWKSYIQAFVVWWSMMALELLFLMAVWRLQGIEEEAATMMMTFSIAWPVLLVLFVALGLGLLVRKNWVAALLAGIGTALVQDTLSGVFVLIMTWLAWQAVTLTDKETRTKSVSA